MAMARGEGGRGWVEVSKGAKLGTSIRVSTIKIVLKNVHFLAPPRLPESESVAVQSLQMIQMLTENLRLSDLGHWSSNLFISYEACLCGIKTF